MSTICNENATPPTPLLLWYAEIHSGKQPLLTSPPSADGRTDVPSDAPI